MLNIEISYLGGYGLYLILGSIQTLKFVLLLVIKQAKCSDGIQFDF